MQHSDTKNWPSVSLSRKGNPFCCMGALLNIYFILFFSVYFDSDFSTTAFLCTITKFQFSNYVDSICA